MLRGTLCTTHACVPSSASCEVGVGPVSGRDTDPIKGQVDSLMPELEGVDSISFGRPNTFPVTGQLPGVLESLSGQRSLLVRERIPAEKGRETTAG